VSGRGMHADEFGTDVALVRRLAAAQFPQWADLSIEPVQSAGTDNAIYRLGDQMAVRLPRIASATGPPGHEVADGRCPSHSSAGRTTRRRTP
jgi:aminoglycoside phosphotransferase (APT) family kinase protein